MKPRIDGTQFGSITIDGSVFEHDVILRLSGKVKKRKKKLSKRLYGTSHTISLDEAKHVYEDGAKRLIVGAGQHGNVALSDEARLFQAEGVRGRTGTDANSHASLEQRQRSRDRAISRDLLSSRQHTGGILRLACKGRA